MATGNLAADGSTAWVDVKGKTLVHFSGTFGGGTVQIEFKDEDGDTQSYAGEAYTSSTTKVLDIPERVSLKMRGTLSGATSPSIDWTIRSNA